MTILATSFDDLDGNRTNVCIADLNRRGCAHTNTLPFYQPDSIFAPRCNTNGCNLVIRMQMPWAFIRMHETDLTIDSIVRGLETRLINTN